ncbi:MAG: hypothetical protein IJO76_03910, partial [Clostridia bacterium]|nr:hypothetical protein [Clostridia bacterium]
MKTIAKRALALTMTVLMLLTVIPFSVGATTVTLLDGTVSITDSQNKLTTSGNNATATAAGGLLSQKTNNITITNESGGTAKLSFSWAASNYSSFTDPNGGSTASGTYSAILEAGATVTLSIKGKKALSGNTATLNLNDITLEAASASSQLTVVFDSALGSVKVDGAAVSSGATKEVSLGTAVALVATPVAGATFQGWINAETQAVLSTSASCSLDLAQNMTVKPVFTNAASVPHFGVGAGAKQTYKGGVFGMSTYEYYTVPTYSYIFDDLNAAASAAAASSGAKYLVLLNNSTLPAGDYTIPAGVNLLIPFSTANKFYTDYPESTGDSLLYTTPTAYRTLTLAEGANLTVNGKISVSAQHRAANGAKENGGSPSGPISFVRMEKNSNIVVKNGGVLYAWGFVTGEGTVTAESGAAVHENFQIMDFRGGNQTTQMKNGVFPVNQYYVQNIEVPLILQYGAKEYSCLTMYMQSSLVSASVAFIGPSGAMFNLTSGYVTKEYDGSVDRLYISLNGDMVIQPISIDLGLSKMDSEDYVMPLGNNLSMFVNSGDITLSQDVAMLPGAEMFIAEAATCTLSNGVSVYVYDLDQWGNYVGAVDKAIIPVQYAPGKTYTRTEADLKDATVVMNGTMDGTLGYLYTTAGGANVISDGTGVVDMVAGTQTATYQFTQLDTTYHEIPIVPAVLTNGDGSQVITTSGRYEYIADKGIWCNHVVVDLPAKDATCTETGLTAAAGCPCGQNGTAQEVVPALGHAWTDATCTAPKACSVCGATEGEALGHTEVVDAAVDATCTETGLTVGSHCSVCGGVIVAQEIVAAKGHTEVVDAAVDATCTETGLTAGSHCSVCGEVIVAQEIVAAKGHTAGAAADCTNPQNCTVCGAELNAALGHTEVVDAAVDATCTETGLTAGSHCSVCGEVIIAQEVVAAKGHTEVVDAAVDATCTETGLTA